MVAAITDSLAGSSSHPALAQDELSLLFTADLQVILSFLENFPYLASETLLL
jgi:hypothetical protein